MPKTTTSKPVLFFALVGVLLAGTVALTDGALFGDMADQWQRALGRHQVVVTAEWGVKGPTLPATVDVFISGKGTTTHPMVGGDGKRTETFTTWEPRGTQVVATLRAGRTPYRVKVSISVDGDEPSGAAVDETISPPAIAHRTV